MIAITLSHRRVHRLFEYFGVSLFLFFSARVYAFSRFSNDLTRPAVLRTIDSRSLVEGPSYKHSDVPTSNRALPLREKCVELAATTAAASPSRVSQLGSRLSSSLSFSLSPSGPPSSLSSFSCFGSFVSLASLSRKSARVLYLNSGILRRRCPSAKLNDRVFHAITIFIPDRYYDVTIS